MEAVNPLHHFTVEITILEQVVGMDPLEHENAVLDLDLAGYPRSQCPVTRLYPARLQRAPEGAGQSAACRGHQVVDRARVGRQLAGVDPVVSRDL